MAKVRQKRTWGEFFADACGFNDSRNWRLIFLVATFFGLVTNFVLLLGCMSKGTQSIYLHRISSSDLINATSQLANVSASSLEIEELPNHWYFGLSGVCAIYNSSETYCQRSFPPTMSIRDLVSSAIRNQIDDDARFDSTVTPWLKAIAKLEEDGSLSSKQNKSDSMAQASAALAVLSILIGFALLTLAFSTLTIFRNLPLWTLYIPAFFDSLLLLASGILCIYSLNQGPRSIINEVGITYLKNERDIIGPGFYVLFAGVLIKLVSIGIFFLVVFLILVLVMFAVMACLGSICESDSQDVEVRVIYETREPNGDYLK